MQVSEYKLLAARTADDLTVLVRKAIGEGWQPWGSPTYGSADTVSPYLQAVVRYVNSNT